MWDRRISGREVSWGGLQNPAGGQFESPALAVRIHKATREIYVQNVEFRTTGQPKSEMAAFGRVASA